MHLVLIGIGGAFGGICRFILGRYITRISLLEFPVGTFIINITGAFLLGIITGANFENSTYLLLGESFLGAYTTFSTFMYEGFNLFQDKEKLNAVVYIFCTLLLGIIGYISGFQLAS